MDILITLCARGGSKGIPGKNIRMLAGKPLIAYSIEIAKQFSDKHPSKIVLSTDDQNIKSTAESFGLYTDYIRPEELSHDTAGKIDTIRDLLFYEEGLLGKRYDFILDLDITSPLRTLNDLEQALSDFECNEDALSLFSVNPAARNPYFNMVEANEEGFYSLVKKGEDGAVMSRQKAPKVYELNASFYWYRRSFFDGKYKSPITDNSLIFVMDHICFDLDHMNDFDFMEYLLLNNKVNLQ